MIAMIRGTVLEKSVGEAIIMTESGIGFRVLCTAATLSALPGSEEIVSLLTYMNVRDDAMELYGFATKEERELFKRLISVSGVGPKIAIGILGSMSVSDLRLAILMGDDTALCRAPGIGKKTAQRITLELKDALKKDTFDVQNAAEITQDALQGETSAANDALLALKSLGYSAQEAAGALRGLQSEGVATDELIRLALRRMVQNN